MSSLNITQGTQSAINFDLSGTINTQVVAVSYGTISTIGTLPTITINTPNIGTIGTLGLGSVVVNTLPNLPQGSIQVTAGTIASVGTIGTLGLGSVVVNTLPNIPGGTINQAVMFGYNGVSDIAIKTDSPGNLYTIGTVNTGSIIVTAGTIASIGTIGTFGLGSVVVNTLPNLPQGSINVTAGTIATLGTMGTLGLVNTVTTVSNLTNGSIHVTAGTDVITSGSINVIAGTVNSGTINVGTVQLNPLTATNTISHAGTSGTTGIGTLVGTASIGAGTALYPTHISILALSGTPEVCLAFGSQTNGAQVIRHGVFPAGGGLEADITYPHGYGTTNSPLTYQIISGAGTVQWDVNYFTHT